jgi:hypothetical protein
MGESWTQAEAAGLSLFVHTAAAMKQGLLEIREEAGAPGYVGHVAAILVPTRHPEEYPLSPVITRIPDETLQNLRKLIGIFSGKIKPVHLPGPVS